MVRIVKENKELLVTKSAWKEYYKNSGWLIDEKKEDNSSESEWDEVLAEEEEEEIHKPISEMTNAELRVFAKEHNIDLSGLNSNKQIREAIKQNLNM